jgi:transketolase
MIITCAFRTGRVVTAEEAQIAGGLGGAVAELLGDRLPTPLLRLGMNDQFGESGTPMELFEHFGLTADHIAKKVEQFVHDKPQYHRQY